MPDATPCTTLKVRLLSLMNRIHRLLIYIRITTIL